MRTNVKKLSLTTARYFKNFMIFAILILIAVRAYSMFVDHDLYRSPVIGYVILVALIPFINFMYRYFIQHQILNHIGLNKKEQTAFVKSIDYKTNDVNAFMQKISQNGIDINKRANYDRLVNAYQQYVAYSCYF